MMRHRWTGDSHERRCTRCGATVRKFTGDGAWHYTPAHAGAPVIRVDRMPRCDDPYYGKEVQP